MPLHPHGAVTAYGDESFLEAADGGFYVLAAATFSAAALERARAAMLAIRGTRHIDKLHWNEMDARQQKAAALEVAGLEGFHVVVVGAPVPQRRQERARAQCLARLVPELHGLGVEELVLEGRTPGLDQRDVKTAITARYALPKGSRFVLNHQRGHSEPLLWSADIVAGAVRAQRHGDTAYQQILADCLYDIEVDTGC